MTEVDLRKFPEWVGLKQTLLLFMQAELIFLCFFLARSLSASCFPCDCEKLPDDVKVEIIFSLFYTTEIL
jgi:hypothetical protein